MQLLEDRYCLVHLCKQLDVVPPRVATCTWVCDAPRIPQYLTIFTTDNKSPKFFLNEIRNVYDTPPALSHKLYLLVLRPFQRHKDVIPSHWDAKFLVRTTRFVCIHSHGMNSHLER